MALLPTPRSAARFVGRRQDVPVIDLQFGTPIGLDVLSDQSLPLIDETEEKAAEEQIKKGPVTTQKGLKGGLARGLLGLQPDTLGGFLGRAIFGRQDEIANQERAELQERLARAQILGAEVQPAIEAAKAQVARQNADTAAARAAADANAPLSPEGKFEADKRAGNLPKDATKKSVSQEEFDRKVAALVAAGRSEKEAISIANGFVKLVPDPVTGAAIIVDISTGEAREAVFGEGGDQDKVGNDGGLGVFAQATGNTLWDSASGVPGVLGAVSEFVSRTAGQIPGFELSAEQLETIDNRTYFRLAQSNIIRALSINPRFPVAEVNRIKKEIDLAPSVFDSADALRQRMETTDKTLRPILKNELRAARNRNLPVETRRNAAAAANEIENFLNTLGVPQPVTREQLLAALPDFDSLTKAEQREMIDLLSKKSAAERAALFGGQ